MEKNSAWFIKSLKMCIQVVYLGLHYIVLSASECVQIYLYKKMLVFNEDKNIMVVSDILHKSKI